jgi:hypothetical protein
MDKRIGKYGNTKEEFVRPSQDIFSEPVSADLPLHRTYGIGDGYFVILPLMNNDWDAINEIVAKLQKELKIGVSRRTKPIKTVEETA